MVKSIGTSAALALFSYLLFEKEGSVSYLMYIESVYKKYLGGLKHRKVESKQVKHYANTEERPDHCSLKNL